MALLSGDENPILYFFFADDWLGFLKMPDAHFEEPNFKRSASYQLEVVSALNNGQRCFKILLKNFFSSKYLKINIRLLYCSNRSSP